ncbi:unnamed protein product [Polarella glacialis]|uniref:Uncharacterized protein n=2 Tax=Polarella glacialis TaxID=89957 RepID=A0A813F011_POLGL|nr:unnamed protein product [Polarella glacialis]|mmetsp:Transcript_55426/g.89602  ORF Transcript_55426/g.89602 Transcript_55426/m.89602 type:complete len:221 (+) Transcript_55426:35-697(+)
MISSYEEAFGGMGHWATAAYAPGASCSAAAVRQISGNWSNLPVDLERHAEMFARDHLADLGVTTSRARSSGATPGRRGRRSVGIGFRPPARQGSSNQYNPWHSREQPRGKACHFPKSITQLLPNSPDPLGFTLYSPSTAKGKATVHSQGIVPVQEGLQGPRGRINRFPAGGYPMDPVWHRMSRTEESPQPWTVYAELEGQPRGRGSSYPKDLDPYPDCAK